MATEYPGFDVDNEGLPSSVFVPVGCIFSVQGIFPSGGPMQFAGCSVVGVDIFASVMCYCLFARVVLSLVCFFFEEICLWCVIRC